LGKELNVLSSQSISSFFFKFLVELVLETIEHFHIFLMMWILAHCFICALYAWSKFPLLVLFYHPFHDVDGCFWNFYKIWFEIKLILRIKVTTLLLRKCLVGMYILTFDLTPRGWMHCLILNLTIVLRVKTYYDGQKMWSQILFFQNYATFNFHQARIKRAFHRLYSK
jgi:hypothetical protein